MSWEKEFDKRFSNSRMNSEGIKDFIRSLLSNPPLVPFSMEPKKCPKCQRWVVYAGQDPHPLMCNCRNLEPLGEKEVIKCLLEYKWPDNNQHPIDMESMVRDLGRAITARFGRSDKESELEKQIEMLNELCLKAEKALLSRQVSAEEIYIELCLEAGNKERGDLLNSKEKEQELWRYATAIAKMVNK